MDDLEHKYIEHNNKVASGSFTSKEEEYAAVAALNEEHNAKVLEVQEQHEQNKSNIETQYNIARFEKLNENLQTQMAMFGDITSLMSQDLDKRVNKELDALKKKKVIKKLVQKEKLI